jgi:leucyl-tRNA synthetase
MAITNETDNKYSFRYDFKTIEAKWQELWLKESTYKVSEDDQQGDKREKYYVL